MGVELGTGLLHNVFTETTMFNILWIFNLLATLIFAWVITSDKEKMPLLWLPLSIMFWIFELTPSLIILVIFTIIFVVKAFSSDIVGNILRVNTIKGIQESGLNYKLKESNYKKNMDYKNWFEEMKLGQKKQETQSNWSALQKFLGGKK